MLKRNPTISKLFLFHLLLVPVLFTCGCSNTVKVEEKGITSAQAGNTDQYIKVNILDPSTGKKYWLLGFCKPGLVISPEKIGKPVSRPVIILRTEKAAPPETRIWH